MIEFNEIHHVALETGDVGAIYAGRDWTFRSNRIRHNFIHHTGGALTDMAERCGSNSYCGGSSIEPISEDDARAFLESHGGTSALEVYFPDDVTDA